MKKEICYLLGALRDGSLPKCGIKKEVSLASDVNLGWLEKVAETASECFGMPKEKFRFYEVWDKKSKVPCFRLKVYSKKIYESLCEHYEPGEQFFWETPKIVREADLGMQKEYVAGFYDAEGGCRDAERFCSGKTKTIQCWASFVCKHNGENEPLVLVKKVLQSFGVSSHLYDNDELVITGRENLRRFYDEFPLKHPAKRKKLKELLLYFGTPSAKA